MGFIRHLKLSLSRGSTLRSRASQSQDLVRLIWFCSASADVDSQPGLPCGDCASTHTAARGGRGRGSSAWPVHRVLAASPHRGTQGHTEAHRGTQRQPRPSRRLSGCASVELRVQLKRPVIPAPLVPSKASVPAHLALALVALALELARALALERHGGEYPGG
jgi:hypothetical protein